MVFGPSPLLSGRKSSKTPIPVGSEPATGPRSPLTNTSFPMDQTFMTIHSKYGLGLGMPKSWAAA